MLLAASTAYAVPSDLVIIRNGGGKITFERALSENGEGLEMLVVPGVGDGTQAGLYSVVSGANDTISDVFGVNNFGQLMFLSDPTPEDILLFFTKINPKDLFPYDEKNRIDGASQYLDPDLFKLGFRVDFFSDDDHGHLPVPDGGSTVALLGIALAGIEGLRRKLRAA